MIEALRQTFRNVRSKLTEQVYTLPLSTYTKLVGELQFLKDLNTELQRQRDMADRMSDMYEKKYQDCKTKWTSIECTDCNKDLKLKASPITYKGRKVGSKNRIKPQ